MQTSADKNRGSTAVAVPIDPALPPPLATDEMGNELEAVEVWHVESACVVAGMYPSISSCLTREDAERSAEVYRRDASKWAAVRITGPHTFLRPKKDAIQFGPRVGTAADLGCAVLP